MGPEWQDGLSERDKVLACLIGAMGLELGMTSMRELVPAVKNVVRSMEQYLERIREVGLEETINEARRNTEVQQGNNDDSDTNPFKIGD